MEDAARDVQNGRRRSAGHDRDPAAWPGVTADQGLGGSAADRGLLCGELAICTGGSNPTDFRPTQAGTMAVAGVATAGRRFATHFFSERLNHRHGGTRHDHGYAARRPDRHAGEPQHHARSAAVRSGSMVSERAPRNRFVRLRRWALECLDRVGMLDKAEQRADTLSGGQQQRVAIARGTRNGQA
jgi:hypothetical protein